MILISACLCGVKCKYNHENNTHPVFVDLLKQHKVIPVCPEQMGGLPTPRPACEIMNGTGRSVLEGEAEVMGKDGQVYTEQFIHGAQEALNIALVCEVSCAVLQRRSPSCGVNKIYDGSFSSQLIPGDGVTAALLRENGIPVLSDEEFLKQNGGN